MNTELILPPAGRDGLRVFCLCLDSPALERARWLRQRLTPNRAERRNVLFQTWKLDSAIAADSIRDLVAQDAAESDLLVIAAGSLEQRAPGLAQWLRSVAPWKQTGCRGGLLIGLLGGDEEQAGELAWLINELSDFARRMGMRFLWQWMTAGALQETEWLEAGIEEAFNFNGDTRPGLVRPSTVPLC